MTFHNSATANTQSSILMYKSYGFNIVRIAIYFCIITNQFSPPIGLNIYIFYTLLGLCSSYPIEDIKGQENRITEIIFKNVSSTEKSTVHIHITGIPIKSDFILCQTKAISKYRKKSLFTSSIFRNHGISLFCNSIQHPIKYTDIQQCFKCSENNLSFLYLLLINFLQASVATFIISILYLVFGKQI